MAGSGHIACAASWSLAGAALAPATPLWQRVPSRDENGNRLSDFMMLVPGLVRADAGRQRRVLRAFEGVLRAYGDAVVFVECNLRLGLLWVSVRSRPGLCLELPAALHDAVPEARLVAPDPAAYRSGG